MPNIKEPASKERKKKSMSSKKLALQIAKLALNYKAKEIQILKMKNLIDYADYFVICSGTNDKAVRAIAEHVHQDLKKDGITSIGKEGLKFGQWILLDFGDVIFHVFYVPVRDFYELEKLWSDAPRVALPEQS